MKASASVLCASCGKLIPIVEICDFMLSVGVIAVHLVTIFKALYCMVLICDCG